MARKIPPASLPPLVRGVNKKKSLSIERDFQKIELVYNYLLFLGSTEFCQSTILTRERTMAKISAPRNPSRENHGTILATSNTIRTLIMNDTRPRVRILRGNVIIFKNIPIVLLTIARRTATIIAVKKPSIWAPGVMYEAMITTIPETNRFTITFINEKIKN